jgi:hypothetical protein
VTDDENGGTKRGLGWKPVAGMFLLGVLTVVIFVAFNR